jgi:hypothetical protein
MVGLAKYVKQERTRTSLAQPSARHAHKTLIRHKKALQLRIVRVTLDFRAKTARNAQNVWLAPTAVQIPQAKYVLFALQIPTRRWRAIHLWLVYVTLDTLESMVAVA